MVPVWEGGLEVDGVTCYNDFVELIGLEGFKEGAEPDACLVIVVVVEGVGCEGKRGSSKEFVLVSIEELFNFIEHLVVKLLMIIEDDNNSDY